MFKILNFGNDFWIIVGPKGPPSGRVKGTGTLRGHAYVPPKLIKKASDSLPIFLMLIPQSIGYGLPMFHKEFHQNFQKTRDKNKYYQIEIWAFTPIFARIHNS